MFRTIILFVLMYLMVVVGTVMVSSDTPESIPYVAPHTEIQVMSVTRGNKRGTGFVVADGLALTASHVIEGVGPVTAGGFPATVLHADPEYDIALLDVPGIIAPNTIFCQHVTVGERVWLVGMFPWAEGAERVVVPGHIADESFGEGQLIMLSSAAQPGLSGSPVVNADGNVIGMLLSVPWKNRRLRIGNHSFPLLVSSKKLIEFILREEINAFQHLDPIAERGASRGADRN